MTKPLRPEEVAAAKLAALPEGVIELFNELIAVHFDGRRATFNQAKVIHALLELGIAGSAQEIFDRHLLDVEPVYRAAGWMVTYDKPGFNEPGDAFFTFSQEG